MVFPQSGRSASMLSRHRGGRLWLVALLGFGCLAAAVWQACARAEAPFAAVRGTYFGLFSDTNQVNALSAGGFKFTVSSQGSLSGVWQTSAGRLPVRGRFNPNGTFSQTITRAPMAPFTVTLALDMAGGTGLVSGSMGNGTWTAALRGERVRYTGFRHGAPATGRYTLIFPGDCALSNVPCGDSYATVSVSKQGSVRLSGVLADGTKFTQATGVSADGQWPLYVPLYHGQGGLWSWLTFTNPPTGDLGGEANWLKPPMAGATYYPGGFSLVLPARGTPYFGVRRGVKLLSFSKAALVLSGGGLGEKVTIPGAVGNGSSVRLGNQSSLSLSVGSGMFHGHAAVPGQPKPIEFGGVLLRQSQGCGCFLGQGQSGRVRLGAANDSGYVAQFATVGSAFAPVVDVDGVLLEDFLWTWSDGSVSGDYPNTLKSFDSAQSRLQSLTVYPPDAVVSLNLGFDGIDGGWTTPLPPQAPQGVSAVYFPAPLPSLKYWASAYNPITNTLDFTGFNGLEIIECYGCSSLPQARVAHLPLLRRACLEACALKQLDLSGEPNLEDVRAALNQLTDIVLGEGTGPKIRHWCTRDNPTLTCRLQDIQHNFFSLREFYVWNDHQSGALSFVSTNLLDVQAQANAYTSADLSGQTNLTWCYLNNNRLGNLVLTTCANLQVLDVHQNQLPAAVLDRLLELLDTTGTNLRTVDLSQNAETPSSAGYQHYQNLVNRGVQVIVDF